MTVYYDKQYKAYKFHFQYNKKNYKSGCYHTKKQAEKAEKAKRDQLNGKTIYLSTLIARRLADYDLHDQSTTKPKVEQLYRCRVKPCIVDKDVETYTLSDINDMAARIKNRNPLYKPEKPMKKQSNNSVNTAVKRLGSVFNWGIRMGLCTHNPCLNFEQLKYVKPEKKYWTDDDLNTVLRSLKPEQYKVRARLELFFWTGMRRSEGRALTWKDIDFDNKNIVINKHMVEEGGRRILPGRKNGTDSMTVPIDDELVEVLKATKKQDQHLDGFRESWYVLCYKNPFVLSAFAEQLDSYAKHLNVPRITPHGLRHSHVSWLYSNTDLTIQEIADRIGDTVETVQKVYAHLYKENTKKVVDAINTSKKYRIQKPEE